MSKRLEPIDTSNLQDVALDEKRPLRESMESPFDTSAGSGASPLDQFFKKLEEIQNDIQTYTNMVESLKVYRSKDPNERQNTNLGEMEDSIKTHMKDIKKKIYDLIQYCNQTYVESGDHQIRKLQVESLKKRFLKAIEDNQKLDKRHENELKERMVRQYKIANPDAKDEEIEMAIENDDTAFFSASVLSATRKAEGERALQEVKARHQDIKKIEASILELHDLYNEMQTRVELAEPLLEKVEVDMQKASTNLDEAQEHLLEATDYAKSARRKKFWILGIVLGVLAIVIIILVVYFIKVFKKQ